MRMYINGAFTSGSAKDTIQVINPATEEILDIMPVGTAVDVDTAVSAAKTAFPSWKRSWPKSG